MNGTRINGVITARGEFAADEVVLCGGSWSPVIARELGLNIPLQAGKGYSLTLTKPRQLPQICAICTEARVAVTPMGGALRVGGTMEIAGLNGGHQLRCACTASSPPRREYYPQISRGGFRRPYAMARTAAVFAGWAAGIWGARRNTRISPSPPVMR